MVRNKNDNYGGIHQIVYFIETKLVKIVKDCVYPSAVSADNFEYLDVELKVAKLGNGRGIIEVRCSIGARADLGRPTTVAKHNK